MIRLTGSQNSIIKEIRSLRGRKAREDRGLYFIEGSRFVEEAVNEYLKGTVDVKYIVVSDSFANVSGMPTFIESFEDRGIKIYIVPDSLFGSISDTSSPQGIMAVMALDRSFLRYAQVYEGVLVILDNIRDPGNMGAIIRTADAAGCAGVIIPNGCVDLFNPKVLRSTMGSVYHLPLWHCGSIREAVDFCTEKGFSVCVSHLEGALSIYDVDISGNVAIVIGSEADGVSGEAVSFADMVVKIPMEGRAESLNASVAAGILIFEAVRQRIARKQE